MFNRFKKLKTKRFWGNKFWARGYCVDTVGLDSDMTRKFVKYQEQKEKYEEQGSRFEISIEGDEVI